MPNRNNLRNQLSGLLSGLGLGGSYSLLIDRAIRQDWDAQEFLTALTKTKEFRRSFPGLLTGGRINDFLAGGRDSITAGNLGGAIARYKQLQESYEDVLQARGYSWFRLTRGRLRQLINGETSVDEFGQRLQVWNTLRENPELMSQFNSVLKAGGKKTLDQVGFMRFLQNPMAQRDLYDYYEATRFVNSGLFGSREALGLARSIGVPGEVTNVDELVRKIREDIGFVGPELERQGVDRVQLANFLANPGTDPNNIAGRYNTIVANRQNLGQQRQGGSPQQIGPGGGLVTQRERETQSY